MDWEDIHTLREAVRLNSSRVAELGEWPDYIDRESLVSRIPLDKPAPGFDAGIACCLGIIPEGKQRVSAALHAAYTPGLVERVRREMWGQVDPDSESVWWLAMCSVCREEDLGLRDFLQQVFQARCLASDPEKRVERAVEELAAMVGNFTMTDFDGRLESPVAYGTRDGCMQGAYLSGEEFAVHRHDDYDLWFIGTYHRTLGLEDFEWLDPDRDGHVGTSGPVHGSQQYVKAWTEDELIRALGQIEVS